MSFWETETTALFRRILPSARMRWLAIGGLWSAVAWLSAIHWRLFYVQPDPWTWWELVWIKHVVWFTWGFLATPIILWLGSRFRLQRSVWPRNLAVLVVSGVVLTAAYVVAYAWLLTINIQIPKLAHFEQMLRFALAQHSTYYFLAFWGTIGLEQGLWYYRRWHEREMQAAQLRSQLAQAQLQALRSQIQPHFLFNVLNTVSSTILDGDTLKAYDLTAKLGDLLRLSLERGENEMITLVQEIELIERYLELTSARFGDRLMVSIKISSEIESYLVPSFILQPFVENSVKHVVARSACPVRLEVRGFQTDGELVLEVEDIPEFPPLTRQMPGPAGRGHRLTEERLQRLYGSRYRFQILPNHSGGTLIQLQIPIQSHQQEQAG